MFRGESTGNGGGIVTKYSLTISRRKRTRTGRRSLSRHWYGRKSHNDGRTWVWVKLYADRRSSEQAWFDLRTRAERLDSGVTSLEIERLELPLAEIFDAYHADLRRQGRDPRHIQISDWMLTRAAKLGGWVAWKHLTLANVHKLLDDMEAATGTASYRNKVIMRLKAFTRWATPEGWANPLAKLKRISERGAKRTRARRAATHAELSALLMAPIPRYRRLAYALAAYNGLRRNEAAGLDAVDIDQDDQTVKVRWKMGEGYDTIPLHPYVVSLMELDGSTQVIAGHIIPAVPDIKTLKKDLAAAGVAFADKGGLRLDYHALRHTFATNLSRAGASSATRRRLMRHLHESVTDRYTHADIEEMAAALSKIPWPQKSGLRKGHTPPAEPAFSAAAAGVPTAFSHQNWTGNMGVTTLSASGPDTQVDYPEGLRTSHSGGNRTSKGTKRARRMTRRRLGLLRAYFRGISRRLEVR